MYSVVLATVLSAGGAAPDCHFGMSVSFGCHGCYGGCNGCYGGCHGCYGGCYGCYGCNGCNGFSGCYGSFFNCQGGCYGGCYGCYGSGYAGCYGSCYGCRGGEVIITPPVEAIPVQPKMEKLPDGKKDTRLIQAPATVVVKAPADARLIVNGQPTAMKGTEQTFATPHLVAGQSYAYLFQVETVQDGKTISKTKRLIVQAGQRAEVDLNDATPDTARITVKLPSDAKLVVDGVTFKAKDGPQTFETPKLEAGRTYYYTLRAEVVRDGKKHVEEKRVVVEAGKQLNVEFNDLPATQTAAR